MTRHFRTLLDLERDELRDILDRADHLRAARGTPAGLADKPLLGKSVAVVFEKASTRTRISFEVGIHELGAQPVVLIASDTQMGRGEPLSDTAKMFSRFVHGVAYRTFGHDKIEALAAASSVPIINALSDDYHPCQLLADLQCVRAEKGRLDGLRVAWVGDGNNMAHSWINAAVLTGLSLRLACPAGYQPKAAILAHARALGADITLTEDPKEALAGVDVVTTDVWTSMGQEAETQDRLRAFSGYLVDAAAMRLAQPDAIFLHCLPAHRGEEVSAEVIDGPQSRVWDEAENRLHAQKALLVHLLG
ncbi:MAG: ornithine carbamoyltransferase [Sandaracinaceae bacterium]|nr:ornithine carbamoyltransferase [Sandaracinaceae bacterium]MBK6810809.1 ornithine carbamoyltransferase [Sandaracinaceae bacterium]MBK7154515.1 ornithine carbamoyltransferase [Sandaracinaceae bacterium]MBK7775590.1 ornithine carbamoyltransferase [Sandaracinaceae bacterium]MBK8406433.1 ornithine carbamoyltransferase [Sandaracinaceae bacterium]